MNFVQKITRPGTILGKKQLESLHKSTSGIAKLQAETLKWKGCRVIKCMDIGPHGAGVGHDEFTSDAMQSYRFVLLFLATANNVYAVKAAEIIYAWAVGCESIINSNAPLEVAWSATCFVRSAELLKYTWTGWTAGFEASLHKFLKSVCLPALRGRYKEIEKWKNNWILTIIECLLQIAIFQGDVKELNRLVGEYKRISPTTFVGALGQNTETTRDLIHAQFQLGSHVQICEMLFHQGCDLYDERLKKSVEYHASILMNKVPVDLSRDKLRDVWFMPSAWDIAYNNYVNRKKCVLVDTRKLLEAPKRRPEGMAFNWGPGWTHEGTF